jgi:Protein of unknown function (DUF3093)
MREYRERLGVPVTWWLVVTASVALMATTLWAGLSITAAIAIYSVLEGGCAAVLLAWGSARISVTASELVAGSERLPLVQIAGATALDPAQTRALRGPRADPAAYLLVRPYLSRAVYVEIAGRPPERPYWLIGTRRPAELAAAIEQARSGPDARHSGAAGHSGAARHSANGGVERHAPGAVG